MNRNAFNVLRYFSEQGKLEKVKFEEDFDGEILCGIENSNFRGKWLLYYENCYDSKFGYRVNPEFIDGDKAANLVTYSQTLHCKVYLWELNTPTNKKDIEEIIDYDESYVIKVCRNGKTLYGSNTAPWDFKTELSECLFYSKEYAQEIVNKIYSTYTGVKTKICKVIHQYKLKK